MTETFVLSEDEALELVAFLVTAARLLPEEPTDYGPMRLVSAAQRLCAIAAPRTTGDLHHLFQHFADAVTPQIRQRNSNPEAYMAFLEESCKRIAHVLARRAGREG